MAITRLFLHMGPGLHAGVERKLLGQNDPQTEFWDQPCDLDKGHAFQDLVKAVINKVDALCQSGGNRIDLIAHSFGGHIATQVLAKKPAMIRACQFISTGYDLKRGFTQLLRRLCEDPVASNEFREKANRLLNSQSKNDPSLEYFWEVVGLIASVPDFMCLYWPRNEMYESYKREADALPPLDFTVFKNVLDDFLLHYFRRPIALAWRGAIHFDIGTKDPLIVVDDEIKDWKSLYPQATFKIHQGFGHFIHLENEFLTDKGSI